MFGFLHQARQDLLLKASLAEVLVAAWRVLIMQVVLWQLTFLTVALCRQNWQLYIPNQFTPLTPFHLYLCRRVYNIYLYAHAYRAKGFLGFFVFFWLSVLQDESFLMLNCLQVYIWSILVNTELVIFLDSKKQPNQILVNTWTESPTLQRPLVDIRFWTCQIHFCEPGMLHL